MSKYSLIKDLNESKQYRSRLSLKNVTARDMANHAFMDLVSLWVVYNTTHMRPSLKRYVSKTKMYSDFSKYTQSGTDLYMSLHYLTTKEPMLNDDSNLLDLLHINADRIKGYFAKINIDGLTKSAYQTFIQQAERDFKIDDSMIKQVRRNSQNWQFLSDSARENLLAWIYRYYKQNAPRSEVFEMIKEVAALFDADKIANKANKPEKKKHSAVTKAAVAGAGAAAGYYAGTKAAKWALGK